MMICKKCGAVISDEAKFCTICGEPQNVPQVPVVETPVVPVQAEQPVEETPVYQVPAYQAPAYEVPVSAPPVAGQPVYSEEPAKKSGKGAAVFSLILGIAALLSLVFCCCGTPLSILFSGIGLILSGSAKKKGLNNGLTKTASVINIISLIGAILLFVVGAIMFIFSLVASGGDVEMVIEDFVREIERIIYGYSLDYYYYAVKSTVPFIF